MAGVVASYRSVHTTVQSNTNSAEFNPFKSSNYSSYAHTTVGTTDVSYSTSTGKLTFAEGGDYLIALTINTHDASPESDENYVIKVNVNGATVFQPEEAAPYRNAGEEAQIFLHFVHTITAGDELEILIDDSASAGFSSATGTTITVQRTRAGYGSLLYTANADTFTVNNGTDSYTSYDSDQGGTVASKLNGSTFAAADGTLTPDTTSTYLVLSSLYGRVNSDATIAKNIINVNGSNVLSGSYKPNSNVKSSNLHVGAVYDLTASQTIKRVTEITTTSNKNIIEADGSGLTILDLSSRHADALAATSPDAKLSMLLTSGSVPIIGASNNTNIFDQDNYKSNSISTSNLITPANITYTPADGKFTFNKAGDYLIHLNCFVDIAVGFNNGFAVEVYKNTTDTSTTAYYEAQQFANPESSYPDRSTVCFFIMTAAVDDFIIANFKRITGGVTSEHRVEADTSISIINFASENNPIPTAALNPASIPARADANEWSQPDAPPPPLFTGAKERDLVKQVNDELIERVIGQTIAYYPIDLERTYFHNLYGEAVIKTFLPPVAVKALVEYEGLKTEYSKNIGLDKTQNITIHFHKRRLTEDQDLFVREGDFVYYGDSFYEIVSLSEPKLIYGQVDHKLEISAKCIRAREGLFDAT